MAALAALLASSPALARQLAGIERAAESAATVLILGEPGTGRSTLARALHFAGPRAAGPFQEIDAAAVPASLFEGEIFGHERGAFTGADEAVPGRVARAAGGSLLIDRVEEIPLPLQPKLLRLVAERRYAPLGGTEREADVRFLAVGSEDLPQRVARGAFREDLYYRLEVLTFRLPPLRERREDVEPLIEFFLADLGERFGRSGLELASGARRWMLEHSWPGNLRELRNVLERAVVLGEGRVLDPPRPSGVTGRRPRPLVEIEQEEIRRALAHTRGHQGRAAELLGISRKALWEKRKRYGIP